MTKFEAIKAQFVTAIVAFIGTIVGLLFERHKLTEDIFLAITSGGFLFIAATSMIPKVLSSGSQSGQGQIILELLCFALGMGFMGGVLLLEGGKEGGH